MNPELEQLRLARHAAKAIAQARRVEAPPDPWEPLPFPDGGQGVLGLGFTHSDADLLLCIYVDGLVVVDLASNTVLDDLFGPPFPEIAADARVAGWGQFASCIFDVETSHGGSLSKVAVGGWFAERVRVGYDDAACLVHVMDEPRSYLLGRPVPEIRALGFSPDGATLVQAEPTHVFVWRRSIRG